ncbi:MAG TPA: molybdopterin-dependent oxidoreductase, partial [Polyangiaceae bacterium]|nr:molybdopterin-dependent oxidoreductase [Polyangiaceae bacterium]
LCPKAAALDDVRLDPDRVVQPLRKTRSGEHTPVAWDEALDEASSRIAAVLDRYGPHALATYTGNPFAHSYAGLLGSVLFSQQVGSRSRFSATSADQLPQMLAAYEVLGHQLMMPVPDLDRTRHLLVLGANPLASNGSVMTAPGMKRRLAELRARGGKVVVVDPRRTETAEVADEHHFVRPGSDALLLAAMIDAIFEAKLERPDRVGAPIDGLDDLRAVARGFSAEQVAAAVGIDADTIRRLAVEHAKADGAACYARLGACTQEFGGVTAWLALALDVVTGNLDRPGGKMLARPAVDVVRLGSALGLRGSFARFRTRVRGLPEFAGELPVAALAEEISTPGEGQIRALVTMAGNPVLSTPNGAALARALPGLDFMVSVDVYRNETTRHADLILPATFGLERDHYDLVFYALAVRNFARYAPAVFPPRGEARDDFDILSDLAHRIVSRRRGLGPLRARLAVRSARALGPKRVLDGLLRTGPHRLSLRALEEAPHGRDLGPLTPRLRELLGRRKVRVAPAVFLGDVERLRASLARPARAPDELVLIGRRSLRSNNSWLHNVERLTKGRKGADDCSLLMHPDDASARGLASGDLATLRSRTGEVCVPVFVSDEIRRGVVSLPHGWGHGGDGLRVAGARPGASVNDVTDATFLDGLSANAAFSGVPVTVARAPEGRSHE